MEFKKELTKVKRDDIRLTIPLTKNSVKSVVVVAYMGKHSFYFKNKTNTSLLCKNKKKMWN